MFVSHYGCFCPVVEVWGSRNGGPVALNLVVWHEETVPKQWRKGLLVYLFKKGDKEDPGNYRGITLLSVVGKVFVK